MGKLTKFIPILVCFLSSIYGIYLGLNKSIGKNFNDGISNIIGLYYAKDQVVNSMHGVTFGLHNIFLSIFYGVLGFMSGGIFVIKFLITSWDLWITGFRSMPDARLFIVLESLCSTGSIICIMILGYTIFLKKVSYKRLLILLSVFLILLLVAGGIEYNVLSKFT